MRGFSIDFISSMKFSDNPDDPRITNRFEAFINTWELANAFSELKKRQEGLVYAATYKVSKKLLER